MIRNYFYLFRNTLELNDELRGVKITDIYTQERDALFFALDSIDEDKTLVVSANPQLPYLLIKRNHKKAKKNYAEFCIDLLPLEIGKIEIAAKDRIIKIATDKLEIYFLLRGPHTNVIFLKKGEWLRGFKKIKDEETAKELERELSEKKFISDYKIYFDEFFKVFPPQLKIDEKIRTAIRKNFPQINKEFFLQFDAGNFSKVEELVKIIEPVLTGDVSVLRTATNKINLLPSVWIKQTGEIAEEFVFEKFQDALAKYLGLKFKYESFSRLYSEVEKKLERDLDFYANKLNNLKARVKAGSRDAEYKLKADLLLANIYRVQKGADKVTLTDFVSGMPLEIELDAKLSPMQNVEKYYEKARDEKINFEKSKQMLANTEKKYFELLEIKEKLATINDVKSLKELKKKLKLDDKTKKNETGLNFKYRKFLIDRKYQVYVGKDSRSNDALTLRFAKQNDIWFHARGVSGSHVVLRIENAKEAVPKSVLKSVASIAAYFSKAKTAKLVPVAYTFRKFVHKRKGAPAGQVLISRETVLIVPPEIPENAEEIYD